ncbi:hypothetical protein MHB71_15305 [Paenibacillus sp. FSL H7-0940]|uniref:hypothetical protein n=1 Tax=Paenibacillus sp. FSL H7-0940 TaxID=2921443 RepID=UPI0030EE0B5F
MITSYDISDRSPQDESPDGSATPHREDVLSPSDEKSEAVRVKHKVTTSYSGVTSSVTVEAVNASGNVIRAESFRLPTVSSRVAMTSRLYEFEQALIQDGYQVAVDGV